LESRRLFSFGSTSSLLPVSTVDYGTSDSSLNSIHVMSVNGTAWDDQIVVANDWSGDVVAFVNGVETSRMPGWWCTAVGVHGRAGNDRITNLANVHATYLYGDDGDDSLSGVWSVGEQFYGGAGRDTVTYEDRFAPVSVALDNAANDGGFGEGDNVHGDVEVVCGGHAGDTLTGGAGDDTLLGNEGDDVLIGNDGNDLLYGGLGQDQMSGNDGNDLLQGGMGADRMFGGNGWDDVDYRDHFADVNVTLDWYAFDGQAGENDFACPDIEAIWGGYGNDRLVGSPGDNCLFGVQGDDTLVGGDGNDTLYGWYGNDILIGGQGTDTLKGEQDDDTLVAVGGTAFDTLEGGSGTDTFWCDSELTESIDADWAEFTSGHVNRVASFMKYHHFIGQDDVVGREPLGEDLPDPDGGGMYQNFAAGRSLFSATTPLADDINQTALGDCYFMATVASMARTNPDFIRRSVVDLGDGTFAVRFFRNNQPVFVRVDADLPTDGMNNLVYARFGSTGVLWGPIVEKAWAYFRRNDSNYKSIEEGFPDEVYQAFGVNYAFHGTNIFGNWEGGSWSLMSYVMNELWSGKSVTVCTRGGSPPKLEGSHCYTVDSIIWDGQWKVRVRNPWGRDGDKTVEGPDDAYLTLTADELAANIDRVYSAWVA
jgi:hypothetical protein